MKVWLDANLDPRLSVWMGSEFRLSVQHVRELTLQTLSDRELFDAARRLAVTLVVTKDSDFVDLVTQLGPPPKIVRLMCGNARTLQLQQLLKQKFAVACQLLDAGESWVEIG